MNHRRRKRSKEHAAAETATETGARTSFEHARVPSGRAELVTTAEALAGFVDHARGHRVLAFDTEFIGEESFTPRICLVQLATTERIVLVDPFEIPDLAPLWELVADPEILTVVHAGEQDIQAVRIALGRHPARLVDTQIAASMIGYPWPSSLGTLIEQLTGHRPGKAHTFTNWDARPLTPSQLRYAADDVRYLPFAWERLEEALREAGRLEWALQESDEVLRGDEVFDPARQVKRAARGEPLRPQALTLLRELVALRHDIARRADQPPRAVLPDGVIVEIAKRRPASRSLLGAIRGLPKRTFHEYGDEIVATIERAKSLPPTRDGNAKLLEDATVRSEIDALWLAAQARCLSLGLAPNMVMSRSVFTDWFAGRIAARRRAAGGGADANGSVPLFKDEEWRARAIGAWLDAFVEGRATLGVGWRDGLVPADPDAMTGGDA